MKKSRKALLTSALSMLLCFSMLLGTTYAWFTDSVESTNNIIQAGNLDVELEYWDKDAKKWESVGGGTPLFEENTLWEPGYTQVVYLRAANKGTLALKYQLGINIVEEKSGIRVDENGQDVSFKLSDSIYMGVKEGVNGETYAYATREAAVDAVKDASGIISKGFNKYGDMNANDLEYLALVVYMPESVGNEANHKTGTEAPKIKLGIKLLATQKTNEEDSFGSDYDNGSAFPMINGVFAASTDITDAVAGNELTKPVQIAASTDAMSAVVPEGVQVEDGAEELILQVSPMEESDATVKLELGQVGMALDVHVDGVAENNTVPMTINLGAIAPTGLYNGNVELYHVENGVTVPMSQVATLAELDAHNEFFYNDQTGEVSLSMASFSTVYVALALNNPWDGTTVDTSWYNIDAPSFEIKTPMELAGFAQIVGGMAEGIDRDSFKGKTITLTDNIDLGGHIWYPIGYYFTDDKNGDGTPGDYYSTVYSFEGTFDGNGKTVADFRQNTWEMKGDNPHYNVSEVQYYNDGMGLFGFINGGTVENLVIDGMVAEGEFTDIGCVTAYARGNCTFSNIRIANASCYSYNCRTAGIVGYDSIGDTGSAYTFKDIDIDPTSTFGALWGSWDVACAGIMGFMNESSTANFVGCEVGCKLDVFNDVCANYQYYQYRYSGMMIGTVGKDSVPSTDIITFKNCTVYYGSWVDYYYCEFEKNSMASYSEDYQFSRVDKDEIIFDNNGNATGCTHTHTAQEDKQAVYLPFKQLYTGYGWGATAVVDGIEVKEAAYTITYVNDSKVLDVTYVIDNANAVSTGNSAAQKLVEQWVAANVTGTVEFGGWMNAGSTKLAEIVADNEEDIVLYPYFNKPYTASFVDQKGNILAWCFFNEKDTAKLADAKTLAESKLPYLGDKFALEYWKVRGEGITATKYEEFDFANCTKDVTLYPYYTYTGAELIPIDSNSDGDIEYYEVGGYKDGQGSDLVVIPNEVNGVPVTTINAKAFASYPDLHAVVIPANITNIGIQSFTDYEEGFLGSQKSQTITLYFEGTPDQWNSMTKASGWDTAMGVGSRVFFLGTDGKVDLSKGYVEMCDKKYDPLEIFGQTIRTWSNTDNYWVFHGHPYPSADQVSNGQHTYNGTLCADASDKPQFHFDTWTDYAGTCDCNKCNGATRPDAKYWT